MKNFRKVFLYLICLSFFTSCAPQNGNESVEKIDNKQLIAALNDSVFCISVIIRGRDYERRFSVGTGFLIGDGLIASAAHVQTKAEEMPGKFEKPNSEIVAWKKFASGEVIQFPIKIAALSEEGDLAIFRFDQKISQENQKFAAIRPLVFAEKLPAPGEPVVSIGYYGDYDFPFNSIGNVSMIDNNEDIFSDLTLMPGNSGAPVCDLKSGEVLGVTVSVLDLGNETVRFGIAKRATKLRALLQKL